MKRKKSWKIVVFLTAVLLSLTCSQVFASIAPSVSQKAAPEVVGAGSFVDAAGNAVTIAASDIKIVADGSTATLSPEAKAVYDQAKAELITPDSNYSKDLAAFITKNYPGVTSDNVVVRDVFDINVGQTLTFGDGQKLELTLSGSYKPGDTVIVSVYNKESKKWDFIDTNDVKVNADGTLTVKFPHLCPVAVMVKDTTATSTTSTTSTTVQSTKENAGPPANAKVEGGSHQNSLMIPVLGGVAVMVIVAGTFVILKKKKSV